MIKDIKVLFVVFFIFEIWSMILFVGIGAFFDLIPYIIKNSNLDFMHIKIASKSATMMAIVLSLFYWLSGYFWPKLKNRNNIKMKWLKDTEKRISEMGGGYLYFMIEKMYQKTDKDFIYLLSEASKGKGMPSLKKDDKYGTKDCDDEPKFDDVTFLIGDYLKDIKTHKHFIQLMQALSDSYIKANPQDKEIVESNMSKLKTRYN